MVTFFECTLFVACFLHVSVYTLVVYMVVLLLLLPVVVVVVVVLLLLLHPGGTALVLEVASVLTTALPTYGTSTATKHTYIHLMMTQVAILQHLSEPGAMYCCSASSSVSRTCRCYESRYQTYEQI
jgi:hypothetical protein